MFPTNTVLVLFKLQLVPIHTCLSLKHAQKNGVGRFLNEMLSAQQTISQQLATRKSTNKSKYQSFYRYRRPLPLHELGPGYFVCFLKFINNEPTDNSAII